ncbi:MAG: cadherin-like beta sandwich domain-containing protein [Bacilli bacterium]|nr:cadherin-like beta sandwich domain-containing protein [bacterium]MDY2697650.1 cadherin-like beta sandwich domain-containing protein [Bacilli bacterium]
MKKVIFYLITVFTLLLPVDLLALSGDLSISCNTTSVKPGQQIKCSVSGNSDGQISMVFANISANGSISIDKFRAERIWDVKTEWPNLSLSSNDKKPGIFEIGTVYLKANSAGTGNFVMSGITFTGDSGETVSIANKSVSISVISDNPTPTPTPEPEPEPAPVVKSSDSSLKSLTVSSGSIDFVPSTLEYNLDVSSNVSTIQIQAVPNDTKATVKLPDKLSLETGLNTFAIVVTAEDGSTTTYKINVNKLENIMSENALLSSLNISGKQINFSSDVFEYKIGNITTSELGITATAIDSNAKIKIFGNNNIGKNGVIIIRVTAEAGNYKDYILYVNNINAGDTDEISTSSLTYLMLIVSSALFVISAIIIVLLLVGRNKYKKKVLAQLDEERKKLELLAVELQNKLAMIPPVKEEEPVPLEEVTKEEVKEEIDKDVLEKKEEQKESEEIEATEVDDVEEVVEEKKEEEQTEEDKINARDILPPEVSELVNSKSEEVVEEVKEEDPLNVTEISAESVADVVKKKPKEEEKSTEDSKKDKKKKGLKKKK